MTVETALLPAAWPESIAAAAQALREGGLVVMPTDTLYGLAGSVYRPDAVERIFEVKRRAPDAGLPVLLATAADLPLVVDHVPRAAWALIAAFWPGALTVVMPARASLPQVVTGGANTVAVRVPAAQSALRLLETLGEPVIGTSANISGSTPATTAAQAMEQLGGAVDAILEDDAAIAVGRPSTVVEVTDSGPIIHRVGAISSDQIRRATGSRVQVHEQLTGGPGQR